MAHGPPTCLIRPGVPTTMLGTSFFRSASFWVMGRPPKKLAILTPRNLALKRSNSWQICAFCRRREQPALPLLLAHRAHLVRQLARVAHDQRGDLARLRVELLEDREHEHRCLAHARLGLAQDVHAEDSVRDALVLNCSETRGSDGGAAWRDGRRAGSRTFGGVLEAAIRDGLEELGLEHELLESGGVDADIAFLLLPAFRRRGLGLLDLLLLAAALARPVSRRERCAIAHRTPTSPKAPPLRLQLRRPCCLGWIEDAKCKCRCMPAPTNPPSSEREAKRAAQPRPHGYLGTSCQICMC